MEEFDELFKRFVINRFIPFPVMLKAAGLSGYHYDSNVFCPFHENIDTPAAKIYHNPDGDILYCFAENKRYKPTDVIRKGLLKQSYDKLFQRLWMQLNEDSRAILLNEFGIQKDFISENNRKCLNELTGFKTGAITYDEVKQICLRMD